MVGDSHSRWGRLALGVLASLIGCAGLAKPAFAATWVAADAYAGVGYFLYTTPPRIERFDMSDARWLTPISLTGSPRALRVDATGIYLIGGATLSRVALTGGEAGALYTADRDIRELIQDDRFVFLLAGDTVWSIRKSDGTLIDERSFFRSFGGLSIAPQTRRLLGWAASGSTEDQIQIPYAADGTLGEQIDSPYHGDFSSALRTWVLAEQTRVANNSGIIFTAEDLFYVGTLAGLLLDIATAGTETIVLRERKLVRYSDRFLEIGQAQLGIAAERLFVHVGRAFAFAPVGTRPAVEIVPLTNLVPLRAAAPPSPVNLAFTPNDVALASDGNVYLLSANHRAIYRWSVAERRYLDSIALAESPERMVYSPAGDALYLSYASGRITVIDIVAPIERTFAAVPFRPQLMAALDDLLFVTTYWGFHAMFDREGDLLWHDSPDHAISFYWEPNQRRLFRIDDRRLNWFDITAMGDVEGDGYIFESNVAAPLRGSADGTKLFAAPRTIYSTDSVVEIGTLPVDVAEAAWNRGDLITLRQSGSGSLLEDWDDSLELKSSKRIVGVPLYLVALDEDDVLAITSVDGRPAFELASAVEDFDQDGVPDPVDNCRDVANVNQDDVDDDGRGDACDHFPVDPDDDGILPDVDNCPGAANRSQVDSDGDRMGDACDPYPERIDNLVACQAENVELQPRAANLAARAQATRNKRDSLVAENAALRQGTRWCSGDVNVDGRVTVDEILLAVNAALQGCDSQQIAAAATDGPFAKSLRVESVNDLPACIAGRDAARFVIETSEAEIAALAIAIEPLSEENRQLRQAARCAADTDLNASVTVDEIVVTVVNALDGCGAAPATKTATLTPAPPTFTAPPTATEIPPSPMPTATPTLTPTLRPAGTPSSDLPFGGVRRYSVGRGPSVAVADLDGDERVDIATANYSDDDISLLFASESERYNAQQTLETGDGPRAIRIADLDVDGIPDIVTANVGGAHTLSIFLGLGGGAFAAERRTALSIRPIDLEITHYDGDAFPDILIGHESLGGGLHLHRGNGDGTFGAAEPIYSNRRVGAAIAGADLDNDGTADVVTLNDSFNATVLLGDGDGGFAQQMAPLVQSGVSGLELADLDGDSIQDLLHTTYYYFDRGAYLYHYKGNGDGTFQYAGEAGIGDDPRTIVSADFNADGAIDVATANHVGDDVTVLLNDGNGGFGAGVCVGAGRAPLDVATADVGGDGTIDLVVALSSADVGVIPGRGDGSFAIGERVDVGYGAFSVTSGDFDQDGHIDLAAGRFYSEIVVKFGDAGAQFAGEEALLTAGTQLWSVVADDVNDDGRTDILGGVETGLILWVNQGNRSFASRREITAGRDVSGIAVADFDGNGFSDIATTNRAAADVSVLLGIGSGQFSPQQRLRVGDGPQALAALDVDQDGLLDLVVMNQSKDVSVLIGDGQGSFAAERRVPLPDDVGAPANLVVADLNRDGLADLATSTLITERVVALLGDGEGGFAVSATMPGAGTGYRFPVGLDAADINADGIVDLVVANRDSFDRAPIYPPIAGEIGVYLGGGGGTFDSVRRLGVQTISSTARGVIGFGANPVAVHIVDLDNNGAPDIVTANGGSGDLTILYAGALSP